MEPKTFKTKTGVCEIYSDRIELKRMGARGELVETVVGNDIRRLFVVYGIMIFGGLIMVGVFIQRGDFASATAFGALELLYAYIVYKNIWNSAAAKISRNTIKTVEFIQGKTGLTRSRFVVHFRDEKGRERKRLIILPGSIGGGAREAEKAKAIMQEEGLIS